MTFSSGLVRDLVCPVCYSGDLQLESWSQAEPGELFQGIVWCSGCRTWYPIEDGLLDLLRPGLAYADDRAAFARSHAALLRRLDLEQAQVEDAREDIREQSSQQAHSDWYADRPVQTYANYEMLPFWQAADEIAFRDWQASVRPGTRLLDVGCAQGRSTFRFMDKDCDIVAFDISKRLVQQAIERHAMGNWRARATFFVADATRFPFRDALFDYVLIYGVLHHHPQPADACREVGRVLRSGGVFFSQENNRTVFRRAFDLLQRLQPLWYEEAGKQPVFSVQELRIWLSAAGLDPSTETRVFLPPQLVNLMRPQAARMWLEASDRLFGAIPLLRDHGGVILNTCVKVAD